MRKATTDANAGENQTGHAETTPALPHTCVNTSNGVNYLTLSAGLNDFSADPRLAINYIGLRNRMSVRSEAYAYATFKERVIATKEFVESVLQVAVKERSSLRRVLAEADAEMLVWRERTIALRTEAKAQPGKVTILGFEEELADGKMHNTGREKEYTVELWDNFEPTLSRQIPWAYAIMPEAQNSQDRMAALRRVLFALDVHAIETQTLPKAMEVPITRLRVKEARSAGRSYQGHVAVRVDVTDETDTVTLPQGTILIRTQQRLGRLARACNQYDLPAGETQRSTPSGNPAAGTIASDRRRTHSPGPTLPCPAIVPPKPIPPAPGGSPSS